MPKVTLDEAGKVVDQVDYWDNSPMFESAPVLGSAMKLVRKLFTS